MAEEHEVEEHVHHAKEPFDKVVAGSMAIIAAMLAIVSVAGQHFNTEKLLNQEKSSDQWAFYQAKNIRHYVATATIDLLKQQKGDSAITEKYVKDAEKYDKDMEKIKEDATSLQEKSDASGERAERFHMGEVFLEIGIVLSSLAILMKRRPFFFVGAASAAVGVVLAARAWMV